MTPFRLKLTLHSNLPTKGDLKTFFACGAPGVSDAELRKGAASPFELVGVISGQRPYVHAPGELKSLTPLSFPPGKAGLGGVDCGSLAAPVLSMASLETPDFKMLG